MEYQFRNEVRNAKKAAMGEMFCLAKENLKSGDKLINFASGHPSAEVFQDVMIKKYIDLAMKEVDKDFFQYGPHAGYGSLRKSYAAFINQKGSIVKEKDDFIITYGATEAVFLAAYAVIGCKDKVIVEVPSYVNAIQAFKLLGGQVLGVRLEEDGVNLDELECAMRQGAKLFYTIPNFSNPSGITMSAQKRKAVYELALKYKVLILEDNTYGDLRYRGKRLSDIKEFDQEGIVVYVGSVSKWIAPSMRIGFMAAEQEFIKRIIPIKAVSSNGVNPVLQYALWRMFEEQDMYKLIRKVCELNSKKLYCMEECMEQFFPESVGHSSPDGGMFIWVTMPKGIDVQKFCRESSVRLHIPITPGNGFCAINSEICTSMRFNFAKESLENIAYGVEKVGGLMKCYRY